jgi:hypothetical protein
VAAIGGYVVRRKTLAMCAALLWLGSTGCFNGPGRTTIVNGGSNRLMLVIEPNRTDLAGTHFLVDTMNGDLWQLDAAASPPRWVRSAEGPSDLAELDETDLDEVVGDAGV